MAVFATKKNLAYIRNSNMHKYTFPYSWLRWMLFSLASDTVQPVLYAMPNKKASNVASCLETYIVHVGVPDIYKIFFGRKYRQRPNSIVTIAEQQEINTNLISDETINA